jgi:hypothetical protein
VKHISFDSRFVNAAGNDLISGKIHTIRVNYDFWKRFEGQEVALFTWAGKPYGEGSKHKVFCVKRIVNVQETYLDRNKEGIIFYVLDELLNVIHDIGRCEMARNDGFYKSVGKTKAMKDYCDQFAEKEFCDWFADYKSGKMAILHFTDFRY